MELLKWSSSNSEVFVVLEIQWCTIPDIHEIQGSGPPEILA